MTGWSDHEDDYAAADTPDDDRDLAARMLNGAAFILDQPSEVPTVWGRGTNVLWAQGEALIIAGGSGVGKTTLATQIVRARLGLQDDVLGLPVAPTASRVLYLAMDRPAQAQRAMSRLFGAADRDVITERMRCWKGPPPMDVAKEPSTLLRMCAQAGADTLVIDSVKDAAVGISEDAVGAGYNRARQSCLAEGIEVLELHHNVKRGADGKPPTSIADVYGSTWITAGAGSVIGLHGEPGDPVVSFRHLKQPADEVGPWQLVHDHDAGVTEVQGEVDLVALATQMGSVTVAGAAAAIFGVKAPTKAHVEKARRRLQALVKKGQLAEPSIIPGEPVLYRPADALGVVA